MTGSTPRRPHPRDPDRRRVHAAVDRRGRCGGCRALRRRHHPRRRPAARQRDRLRHADRARSRWRPPDSTGRPGTRRRASGRSSCGSSRSAAVPDFARALLRNAIKFALPWESGHTAVFALVGSTAAPPPWVIIVLVATYAIPIASLVLLLATGRALHDRVAGTARGDGGGLTRRSGRPLRRGTARLMSALSVRRTPQCSRRNGPSTPWA